MISQSSSSFATVVSFFARLLLIVIMLLLATTRNVAVEASRVEVSIDPATGMMLVKTNATAPWSYACTSNAVMDTNSVIGACKMAGFRYVYSASVITIGVAPAQDKKIAAGLLSCSANPTLASTQPCVFEDFTVGVPSCAGDYTKTLKLKCTGVRTGGDFGVYMGSGSPTSIVDTFMRIDPVRDRLQLRRIFQSIWYDTCPLSSTSSSSSTISSKLCKNFGFESGGEFFDTRFVSITSPMAVTSGADCSVAVSSTATSVNSLYFNIDDFSQTCTIDPLTSFASSCPASAAPVGLHCHSDVMGSLSGEFFVKTPAFQNRLMFRVASEDYTASTAASTETGYLKGICSQGMTQVDADQLCKIMGRSTDQVSFSAGASVSAASVSYSVSAPTILPVSAQVLLASLTCSQTNAVSLGVCSYTSATSGSCNSNTDQVQLECVANDDSGSAVVKFVAYVVPFVVGVCIISVIAMRYRMYQGQKEQLQRLEKEQASKNNNNNGNNNNNNQQETNAARADDDREYSEASDPAPYFPPPSQYQHTQAALQQQQQQQQQQIYTAVPLNNSALLPTSNEVSPTPPPFNSQFRLITTTNENVPMPPPVNGYNYLPQQPPNGYVSEARV